MIQSKPQPVVQDMYRHDLLLDCDSNKSSDEEERSIILNHKRVKRHKKDKKKFKEPQLHVGLLDNSQNGEAKTYPRNDN